MPENPRLVRSDDVTLVVIDVQERLAAVMPHRERIIAATTKLLLTAGLLGWPIVVTRQNPDGLGPLVPEIVGLLHSPEFEHVAVQTVDKTAFSCWSEPSFQAALAASARPQVLIAGMETHICVAQTALTLRANGLGTFVAADACCSRSDADAKIALQRMRREGVIVTTAEAAMYEAAADAGSEHFKELLRIVKGE
jgi:nicotinamidase-related amidase